MCCWRRMEEMNWTVRFRNGEVLHRVKEETKILHTIERKANCIERNIEGLRRWERRRKQLLDHPKEKIGCRKLKERIEFTFMYLCGCGWIICQISYVFCPCVWNLIAGRFAKVECACGPHVMSVTIAFYIFHWKRIQNCSDFCYGQIIRAVSASLTVVVTVSTCLWTTGCARFEVLTAVLLKV
jgi:hypothetical protein